MQVRDDNAWQSVITTTPLYPIRNGKSEDLSIRSGRNTHNQLFADTWLPRNIRNTIAGLENNIQKLRLFEQQPRDLRVRFKSDTTGTEKPAAIAWQLSKKSVVAKDIAMLEKKVRALKNRESPGFGVLSPILVCAVVKTYTTRALNALYYVLAVAARCFNQVLYRGEYRSPNSTPRSQENDQEDPAPWERWTDPNFCMRTAHRWRRKNFPDHEPLRFVEKLSSGATDLEVSAFTPNWVQDSTYIRRHVQQFIPKKSKYPEPTLRGYIRRELETTQPVPRDAFVEFAVMTEQDCIDRWGMQWRLDGVKEQQRRDEKRNVMKREREPSEKKTDKYSDNESDGYPYNELDGYPGWLLEHEVPPPRSQTKSVWYRCRSWAKIIDVLSLQLLWVWDDARVPLDLRRLVWR